MQEITSKKSLHHLKEHFQVTLYDTLLDSAFSGYHGRVLVDDIDNPTILFVDVANTFYYYGDASAKEAKLFAAQVDDYAEIHASEDWQALIKTIYKDKVHSLTRYEMDDQSIDLTHIHQIVQTIPKDLKVRQIDQEMYHQLIDSPWASSLVENFQDAKSYQENGLGFVLMNERGEILSGASSFTRYSKGYEVEIDTAKEHRRKGYAYMVAAYFIQEVMKRGLHTHWDAANVGSKLLAEKLGYTLKRAYDIIEVY